MLKYIHTIDKKILLYIQENIRNNFTDKLMICISSLGDMGFIWVLISFILFILKKKKEGTLLMLTLTVSFLLSEIIKRSINRHRPHGIVENLIMLINEPRGSSFPSAHTATSFAVSSMIFMLFGKKYGILALILSALIGFSRVHLGVHYPSDVVTGMMVGIVSALIVKFGFEIFIRIF